MFKASNSSLAIVSLASCAFFCLATRGNGQQKPVVKSAERTVIDLTVQELRRNYSDDLGRLEFTQNQQALDGLLRQVGDKVDDLFRNFNDVSAREQVVMRRMNLNGSYLTTVRMNFEYLVLVRPIQGGIGFKEERTDRNGNSIELLRIGEVLPAGRAKMSGFVITSGFASLCKYFHPNHQFGSNFRVLGRERRSPHSLVIAFAQKPEVGDFLSSIGGANGLTPVLIQGLIWVDPRSLQILRMRTDLLEPDARDGVSSETTDIRLSEVHFTDNPRVFFMPKQVEVALVVGAIRYVNTHSYSNYKLFRVDTRIR